MLNNTSICKTFQMRRLFRQNLDIFLGGFDVAKIDLAPLLKKVTNMSGSLQPGNASVINCRTSHVWMLYLLGFDTISSIKLNPRMGSANTSEVTRKGTVKLLSCFQDSNLKRISTYPSKGDITVDNRF